MRAPQKPHFLKDRKGYDFPVISDQLGRSHLYNSVQLDVAHAIPDIVQAGITWLLVDSTLMNVAGDHPGGAARCARPQRGACSGHGVAERARLHQWTPVPRRAVSRMC